MTESEWLATEVMGWAKHKAGYFIDKTLVAKDFDPRNNIEQAFMCLDQALEFCLEKGKDSYACEVWLTEDRSAAVIRSTAAQAIIDAILKATGYKDE